MDEHESSSGDDLDLERRLKRLETAVARSIDALYHLVTVSGEAPKVIAKLCVIRDEIRKEKARLADPKTSL